MSSTKLAAVRARNLERLFNPRSIAVVGASTDPAKAGSQAMLSLRHFPGRLMAVNPKASEILGFPCYPSVAELPEGVDLAVLAIPAEHCIGVAEQAAARGVGGIFIISGGFGETGVEGGKLQARLAEVCQRTGLRLLGPNTSGFINPHAQCVASFVPGVDRLRKGRVAVVAQSGGVNLSISFLIDHLGQGVSIAAGLGNAVDVSAADLLPMLARDPNTHAIALHLEGVPNGRALFEAIREVVALKPVVALVAGKADIGEFAVSHTGNLMGSHKRTVSALAQAGAVIVESTEDLAQAAVLLATCRLPARRDAGLALVTGQAGPGLLIVDGLKSGGVKVPEFDNAITGEIQKHLPPMTFIKNPVDTGRPGPGFPRIVEAVAGAPGIDAVLVYSLSEPSVLDPVAALAPARERSGKPVVFGTLGLRADLEPAVSALGAANIPAVLSPERLVLAGRALAADARGQWRAQMRTEVPQPTTRPALAGSFDESRAKALLAEYGIRSPQRVLCRGRDEALAAFARLTAPVVVKIAASDVPHKTEVGGVHLGIRDRQGMEKALDAIDRIPTGDPGKVLIEEMAPEGVELVIGGVRDPSWGVILMVGLGGVLAEALADSSVRLAPVSANDVQEMLGELRGNKLLDGFRTLPVCDRDVIAAAVIGLGRLLMEHPEIAEVEVNPLRVNAEGALALDALVVFGQLERAAQ
ncbi:MAG: acetate--CoA ligase family protein [Rhodocyclaceae bacterium]|nr:acetate--CoA ligase family protein [Rhodocyclaceae bacterium]